MNDNNYHHVSQAQNFYPHFSFLQFFPFTAVSCSAPSGAEYFPAPCFWLFQLHAAYHTAVMLLTPDRIIQSCQFSSSGESVCLTVCLNLIFLYIQNFADCTIAQPFEPHHADGILLLFCHILHTPFEQHSFVVSTRASPSAESIMRKNCKNCIFALVFRRKSPFCKSVCNETMQDYQSITFQYLILGKHETLTFPQCHACDIA